MSPKILPLSNDSDKSSHLMHREDGVPQDESRSLEHSHMINEAGERGREAGPVRETRRIPQRRSQLPQKATARQSSMQKLSSKETDRLGAPSSEITRDSHRGPGAEPVSGKSGLMPKHRARDSSSRGDMRTMLPPMQPVRALSTQRHRFDGVQTKTGNPKPASNRLGSQPDAPISLKSLSRSSIEPSEMGVAKVEPRIAADQVNQRASGNVSPGFDNRETGLVTAKSHYHGTDGKSGHLIINKFEFNKALMEPSRHHGRSRSQQLSNATTLPSVEVATRKISSTHQHRPPFSTLQRHFSPKKVLTGSIPPVLAQPTTKHGGSHELSTENVQIQTELTQLHLLLDPAVEVQKQWERSAKSCLQSHFELLRERHFQLEGLVQSHRVSVNHSALIAWCDELPIVKVAEKLQLLSHNVQEISALIESGGRYTRLLNTFELWFARACRIRDSHNRSLDTTRQDLEFIESIGDDWKIEVASLEVKLSSCSRELRDVGKSQGSSTLAHFLLSFQRAVTNLLDELSMIQGIESDLMAQETWEIEAMIALPAIADDSNTSSIPASYQGIWHAGV